SDRDSDTYTPLLCSVWSKDAPGFVSDADEVKKALRRVLQATDNKGMIYFDDRSMAEEFQLQLLDEPDFNFVAMVQVVDVVYRNKVCSIGSLLDSVKTPYGKIVFKLLPEGMTRSEEPLDVDIFIHAGALAIKMPNSGRNLRLIAVKSRTRLFGGDICVPLITTETDLRSRKALMGLVESHLSLQDVLSAHQTLRNSLEPQSFRVMSYNRLQLLMTLLIGVMHYETATKDRTKVNHQHISQRPHRGDVARTYFHPQQQPASNNSRYSS
ncbi:MAG: hypothetical protein AAFN50_09295, partial [Pseudomonadota bacterium]